MSSISLLNLIRSRSRSRQQQMASDAAHEVEEVEDNDEQLNTDTMTSDPSSSDSIILRVEQEIVAARNAVIQQRQQQLLHSSPSSAPSILNVTPVASPVRANALSKLPDAFDQDSSFERALGTLHDEFRSSPANLNRSNPNTFSSTKNTAGSTWEEIHDVPGPGMSQAPKRSMWATSVSSASPRSPSSQKSAAGARRPDPSPAKGRSFTTAKVDPDDYKNFKNNDDGEEDVWEDTIDSEPASYKKTLSPRGNPQRWQQAVAAYQRHTQHNHRAADNKSKVTTRKQLQADITDAMIDARLTSPQYQGAINSTVLRAGVGVGSAPASTNKVASMSGPNPSSSPAAPATRQSPPKSAVPTAAIASPVTSTAASTPAQGSDALSPKARKDLDLPPTSPTAPASVSSPRNLATALALLNQQRNRRSSSSPTPSQKLATQQPQTSMTSSDSASPKYPDALLTLSGQLQQQMGSLTSSDASRANPSKQQQQILSSPLNAPSSQTPLSPSSIGGGPQPPNRQMQPQGSYTSSAPSFQEEPGVSTPTKADIQQRSLSTPLAAADNFPPPSTATVAAANAILVSPSTPLSTPVLAAPGVTYSTANPGNAVTEVGASSGSKASKSPESEGALLALPEKMPAPESKATTTILEENPPVLSSEQQPQSRFQEERAISRGQEQQKESFQSRAAADDLEVQIPETIPEKAALLSPAAKPTPMSSASPMARNSRRFQSAFERNAQSPFQSKSRWTPPLSTSSVSRASSSSPTRRASNRIRFYDPFPILKAPTPPRPLLDIVKDHSTGKPSETVRWMKPKPDLRQLIVAAVGSSLQRRSNACGALKVLLSRSKKNQITMAHTDSLLACLVFSASQPIPETPEREQALDARTRAVACINFLCLPKQNRAVVLMYPGMVECLTMAIEQDDGEARALACSACALIAKSVGCREALVDEEGLINLMAAVLAGQVKEPVMEVKTPKWDPNDAEKPPQMEEKKEEYGDLDEAQTSEENKDLRHSISHGSKTIGSVSDEESAYEYRHASFEEDLERSMEEEHEVSSYSRSSGTDEENSTSEQSEHTREQTKKDGGRKLDKGKANHNRAPQELQNVSVRKLNREKYKEFLQLARSNTCAFFLHLSKHCPVSNRLCTNENVLGNVLAVANEKENLLHTKCLEILLNFTRFSYNNTHLTTFKNFIQILMSAAESTVPEDRVLSLRCFQNLSTDTISKLKLSTEAILTFLTTCAMRLEAEEKEAAVSTLYNLTTEPGAVVAITNTKNAVATLVHLAHQPNSPSQVRLRASEALATISLWLQTLAGTGKVPPNESNTLPTQRSIGWERWD